jgi:tetratricopeptide (TPR) repeat protein
MFRRNIFYLFFIFSACLIFSCTFFKSQKDEIKKYASLNDSTRYVGMNACRQCHSDKYTTFIKTGMGQSFDVASHLKTSAKFTDVKFIYDTIRNLNYRLFWIKDSLMISEFRLSGKDTIFQRLEKISWIIGSGQHTNSHLININGYMYQAPATYYTQKGQWDLPPGFEHGFNSRFSRAIGIECISCHNAYPQMIEGSENKYSFVPNGIDCERCHGPGSTHVASKQAGQIIDIKTAVDFSIVNPAKLPISLQLDVCQRCHIQGNAVLNDERSFMDFRPGMHLSDVMNVYMPVYSGDDGSHIMASHVERMKLSRCFTVSISRADSINKISKSLTPYENAMTCVTCHDPHVSVRSTDPAVFNSKCKSCHSENHDNLPGVVTCTESMKERLSVNDNCVSCHMPRNGTIDIPHVTTTDHWIRIPLKKKEINKIKEFTGLACINNPGADNKSMGTAYLNYYEKFSSNNAYLDSAKKYLSDVNKDSIQANFLNLIRWAFLKNDFEKVIEYVKSAPGAFDNLKTVKFNSDKAWTAYRIGESYSFVNDKVNSLAWYKRAVQLEPFQLDFRNKLAGIQLEENLIEDSRKNYEYIIRENPKYSSAYVSLGFLVFSHDQDPSAAEKLYDKALSLDPDNTQAWLNKAGIMIYLGKKKEAVIYLREVLKRDSQNEKARIILNHLLLNKV